MSHNLVVSIFFLNSHFQIAYRKYTSSNITEMFIEKLCKTIFYLHDESHKIDQYIGIPKGYTYDY